jgi:hypothetical protein
MLVILIGDGFFPIVSREVAARNRKRRKVIHDRLCGRIPGADIFLPMSPLVWLCRLLSTTCEVLYTCVCYICSLYFPPRAFVGWVHSGGG